MPTLQPSTVPRKRLAELLAEARARTVFLVSPVSEEGMHARPDEAVRSVLQELEQILRFELEWLVNQHTRETARTVGLGDRGRFCTAILATVEPTASGLLVCLSAAGHPPDQIEQHLHRLALPQNVMKAIFFAHLFSKAAHLAPEGGLTNRPLDHTHQFLGLYRLGEIIAGAISTVRLPHSSGLACAR